MGFPKLFYTISAKLSWRNLVRSQGSPVYDDLVARFLNSKSQFAVSTGRIRSSVFLPSPQDLKLSVFEMIGLFPAEIWRLGTRHVGRPSGKTVQARADLTPQAIAAARLTLDRDGNPRRHCSATGWIDDKEDQKERALILADQARLQVRRQGS